MLEGNNMLYYTCSNIIYPLHYSTSCCVCNIDSTNITLDIGLKYILATGDNKQTILFATHFLLRCNTHGKYTIKFIYYDQGQQIKIVLTYDTLMIKYSVVKSE